MYRGVTSSAERIIVLTEENSRLMAQIALLTEHNAQLSGQVVRLNARPQRMFALLRKRLVHNLEGMDIATSVLYAYDRAVTQVIKGH